MRRIAFDSAVVTALNIIGQGASFVLFVGIAALFGANAQTDAFFLAMTIPALFIGTAVSATTSAFIPVLTEYRIKRPDDLGYIVGPALVVMIGLSLVGTAVIVAATPLALSLSATGLSEATRSLAYQHTLLLSPMIAVQTVIGVLAAAYNSAQRFALPAAATVVRYLSTLLLIVTLRPAIGVLSLSIGFTLGTLINLALLALFWHKLQIRLVLWTRLDPDLSQALRSAVPLVFGTAALQLGVVISRFLAAQLPDGSVSVLDYATRIASAIIEVLTSGIFLVTLADWSKLVVLNVQEQLRLRLGQTVMVVMFLVTPIVAMLLVLREPVTALILQRGAFDADMTAVTASVLAVLLIGLPLDVIGRTYVRLFLAWRETLVLGGLAMLRVVSMLALSFALMPALGVLGIALADTLAIALIALCLVLLANRRIGNTLASLWLPLGKLTLAAAGTGAATVAAAGLMQHASVWLMLILASTAGGLCYLVLSWLLRVRELVFLTELIARRQAKG
ncbi:MAG: hypothetical protein RLZZ387_1204 [Chloroflexota bacterium]|jgi:putative peptidoglycan lipid II flippase